MTSDSTAVTSARDPPTRTNSAVSSSIVSPSAATVKSASCATAWDAASTVGAEAAAATAATFTDFCAFTTFWALRWRREGNLAGSAGGTHPESASDTHQRQKPIISMEPSHKM